MKSGEKHEAQWEVAPTGTAHLWVFAKGNVACGRGRREPGGRVDASYPYRCKRCDRASKRFTVWVKPEEQPSEGPGEPASSPLASIKIEQAEGRDDRLIRKVVTTFADANWALQRIADQAREGDLLGYLKTDVWISWEDGTTHAFRADVDKRGTDTNLTAMLQAWAERWKSGSGFFAKKYLDKLRLADWEEQAERLLSGELATSDPAKAPA